MRAAALLFGFALMAVTTTARAIDPLACTEAAESGQRARAEGKLRTAQTQFAVCQSQDCPALVRQDCSKWAVDVRAVMPSIVVDARDAAGRDLADVTVLVDNEVIVATIDGKAIPIDPGPHVLKFQHAGIAKVENAIIKEGMKSRIFTVRFEDGAPPPPPPSRAPEPRPSVLTGGHTPWPWVVVGVGGAAIVTGIVMIATAPSFPSGCNEVTKTCNLLAGESTASYLDRQERAGSAIDQPVVGGIVTGVGAGIVGLGLLWHFLEPAESRTQAGLRVAPWSTASSAGLAALGSF